MSGGRDRFQRELERLWEFEFSAVVRENLVLKQATPDGEELKKLETPRGFLRLIGV